jgi:hypothetical protein
MDANRNPIQISVAGAFGAIPWTHLPRQYGAFWLTDAGLSASAGVWLDVVALVHQAFDRAQQ